MAPKVILSLVGELLCVRKVSERKGGLVIKLHSDARADYAHSTSARSIGEAIGAKGAEVIQPYFSSRVMDC